MELTNKQSEQFISFYMNRYAKEWETTLQCSTRLIEEWVMANKDDEYNTWKEFFTTLLWKKANSVYKYRTHWPETVLSKVLNSLRLNYWPKINEPS